MLTTISCFRLWFVYFALVHNVSREMNECERDCDTPYDINHNDECIHTIFVLNIGSIWIDDRWSIASFGPEHTIKRINRNKNSIIRRWIKSCTSNWWFNEWFKFRYSIYNEIIQNMKEKNISINQSIFRYSYIITNHNLAFLYKMQQLKMS